MSLDLKKLAEKLTWHPFESTDPYLLRAPVETGMVLRLKGQSELYLVGDINNVWGVCDDCREFGWKDVEFWADLGELFPKG